MDDIFYHEEYKMWWPKFDHNPKGNKHTIENGIGAIEVLRKHCKNFDVCVQAGGHLGYWPIELSKHFQIVHAFEVDPLVHRCLKANTEMEGNITAINIGLAAENSETRMIRGASAGGSRLDKKGKLLVDQVKLDDFNKHLILGPIDAILLDIEGGEINALKGAEKTIERFSPAILVEELPEFKEELHAYLESIDYKRVDEYARDGIWVRK